MPSLAQSQWWFLLFLVVTAVVSGVLLLALIDHPLLARWTHRHLAHRLARQRLGSMLSRQNILFAEYLRLMPAADVLGQLDTCQHCAHKPTCDTRLRQRNVGNIGFCPNATAIAALKPQLACWRS